MGTIGIVLLYAMWLWHLLLFRGDGLVTWIGMLVVVQNIVSSVFNSHLFDFHDGWMYVMGVGIAGGMTLKTTPRQKKRDAGELEEAIAIGMHVGDKLSAAQIFFGL